MSKQEIVDSNWLNEILNKIGASEKMRTFYQQNASRMEILHTVIREGNSVYTFGSNSEGTTTPGKLSLSCK